mgnify:CR=1 FL=1
MIQFSKVIMGKLGLFSSNLREMVEGGSPQWIPFTLDIGAIGGLTEPILRRFKDKTGASDPQEYFDYDFRTCSLRAIFGGKNTLEYHGVLPPGITFDEWGIGHWSGGAEGTYERIYSPLACVSSISEIECYPLPVIEKPYPVTMIKSYRDRGYPVFGYAGSLYEWSWWLRGMENFMSDLILRRDFAEAVLDKVAGYTLKLALESAGAGIDVLCFYDDVGMQRGMQISPRCWRTFIKPRWKNILEEVRRKYPQAIFFLHSCGNITEILMDIVELGFHILHPVQPECMDLASIRKRFGKNIVLCATISSQRTFPFGSPDEVRDEVRRLKRTFITDMRCILCPSNRVQPETPWENVVTFVEEAKKDRWA